MKSTATTLVHRFIAGLPPGAKFAARQVIHLGPSKPIYKLLSYLVKTGKLIRVTWGVYVKPVRFGTTVLPTLEEIVALKLKVFDREAVSHDCELIQEIDAYPVTEASLAMSGVITRTPDHPVECSHKEHVVELARDDIRCLLLDLPPEQLAEDGLPKGPIKFTGKFDRIYDIDGSSSSISTVQGIVRFRRVSKRKITFGDTKVGRVVRGLWACGEKRVSELRLHKALQKLERDGREELANTSARGPNWIRDLLSCWRFIKLIRKQA